MFLKIAWAFVVSAGFCYWFLQLIAAIRTLKRVPVLEEVPVHEPPEWPKVSVIMTARNEEKALEKALTARLRDEYPNVEYIIIDDRSTDRTGSIVDEFAAKDRRVMPLHLRELPEGWLGKLYALERGAAEASGDWLLFSDADVHVEQGTLRKAVAYAEGRKIDHLAIFPEIYPVNFVIDILSTIFLRMISLGGRLWEVEDPKSRAAIGSGSFNMVRRSAFERSGAFDAIRLDQGDDVALGQILKMTGSRQVLLNGRNQIGVVFYNSLREAAVATERPTFTALGNFSFVRLFVAGWILLLLELSPYLALLQVGFPCGMVIALVMIPLSLAPSVLLNCWFRRQLWLVFFTPIGSIINVYLIWRAGFLGARRGGVYWRGTFYPTATLRKR